MRKLIFTCIAATLVAAPRHLQCARRARGEKAERRKLKRYGSGYYLAQFDCVVGKTLKSRQDTSSGLFG